MAVNARKSPMPDSTARALPQPGCAPSRPVLRQGLLGLPRFRLHHGGEFRQASVAWRLVGPAGAPVVAALGGISAHRLVWEPEAPGAGWWCNCVGPGRPLDTGRYAVLGIDWIGGTGGSTAPEPGDPDFPVIDARDQAAALVAVCNHLAIARLHVVVGASYGGMVGLALAETAPARVGTVLAISAAHRSNALATGWRGIQRAIVRQGIALGDGRGGLALARALAMTTYRTCAELERRFPVCGTRGSQPQSFAVEQYLMARGAAYAELTSPECFLCLSESIDRFRVDPARIRVPVRLVAVAGDQLVSLAEVRELAGLLAGPAVLHVLQSEYGHDAFLKETELLAPAFRAALEGELT
jgi:homoserine O-acetyltransferase